MKHKFTLIDNDSVVLKTKNGKIIIRESGYYENENRIITSGINVWYQKDGSEYIYELAAIEEDAYDNEKVDVWTTDRFGKDGNEFFMCYGSDVLYFDEKKLKSSGSDGEYTLLDD